MIQFGADTVAITGTVDTLCPSPNERINRINNISLPTVSTVSSVSRVPYIATVSARSANLASVSGAALDETHPDDTLSWKGKTMNPQEVWTVSEMEAEASRRQALRAWGRWRYKASTQELVFDRWKYFADVERMRKSSAECLDTVMQVFGKTWCSPQDFHDFMTGVRTLVNPQATLCSFGSECGHVPEINHDHPEARVQD